MFNKSDKNLLIVAHPDDEILFAYSAITNGGFWKVICCTNKSNPVRSKEFNHIMKNLNIDHEMWDYPDVWGGGFPEVALKEDIIKSAANFNNIVTHSAHGEYGHSQHKALYSMINSIVNSNMYSFGHDLEQLKFRELQNKIKLLELYNSQYMLDAYDWYDSKDRSNNIIKYVVSEGFKRIK